MLQRTLRLWLFLQIKKTSYSVGEGKTSAVTAFSVNENKSLNFINTVNSNGKGPCHVSFNNSGNKAVVPTYESGTVSIYNIEQNRDLNEASQTFDHNTGKKPARAHSAQLYKDDLFASDIGNNAVY